MRRVGLWVTGLTLMCSVSWVQALEQKMQEQVLPMAPERVWRVVQQQLKRAEAPTPVTLDDERFEAHLVWKTKAPASTEHRSSLRLDVDWDVESGGTRLRWSSDAPTDIKAQPNAVQKWLQELLMHAQQSRADNLLCRGPHPTPEEIEAAQIEIPGNCRYSTGHFSSALFELEKCGDFDTALQIMSDCVKQAHSGGLIRLSHYFDMGYGLPKRPERALAFLKMAMDGSDEGYAQLARLHYATALHFGIGIAPDPASARYLFQKLADQGQPDAQEFLLLGHHGAWLRPDGQRYRSTPTLSDQGAPPLSKDDSGNDLSYGAFIDSSKRLKCLYGYAAEKTGDHAAAVRIFEDCISRWNDPYSIIWLAHLLENGVAVPQDLPRATQLLRQGAMHPETAGYASLIRYHYGMALLQGQGTPVDLEQARHWLARAAEEGVSEAQTALLHLEQPSR